MSTQENRNDQNPLSSLPPIQLPSISQDRNIKEQAKTNDSRSATNPLELNERSLEAQETENTSEAQPSKEKKRLVIKRKKVSMNKLSDRLDSPNSSLGDQPNSDKTNASKRSVPGDKSHYIPKRSKIDPSVKNSVLQQIDIFAPKDDNKTDRSSKIGPNAENVCNICKSTFVTKKSMFYHIIEKHYIVESIKSINSNVRFKCPKCSRQFEAPKIAQQLTKHYYKDHLNDHIELKYDHRNLIKDPVSRPKCSSDLKNDNNEDSLSEMS